MKNQYLLFAVLLLAGVALACTLRSDVPPPLQPVEVDVFGGQSAAQAIGAQLQSMYGDAYINDEVYFAAVPITSPFGGATAVPFSKPCGETFQEAGDNHSSSSNGSGGSAGSGSGPVGGEGDPFAFCTVGVREGCSEVAGVQICESGSVLNCPGMG